MFSLYLAELTCLHPFKGGRKPVNSSSCLSCHRWPAHSSSYRPICCTTWTKVCVFELCNVCWDPCLAFWPAWRLSHMVLSFNKTNHASINCWCQIIKKTHPFLPPASSVSHAIPLRCSSPIDFEFQVYVIQPHEAFSIHPLAGRNYWNPLI